MAMRRAERKNATRAPTSPSAAAPKNAPQKPTANISIEAEYALVRLLPTPGRRRALQSGAMKRLLCSVAVTLACAGALAEATLGSVTVSGVGHPVEKSYRKMVDGML